MAVPRVLVALMMVSVVVVVTGSAQKFLDGLVTLVHLHKDGDLNDEEFQAAKRRLLYDDFVPGLRQQDVADITSRVVLAHQQELLRQVSAMVDERLDERLGHQHQHQRRATFPIASPPARRLQRSNGVAGRVASANVWLQSDTAKIVLGANADVSIYRGPNGALRTSGALGLSETPTTPACSAVAGAGAIRWTGGEFQGCTGAGGWQAFSFYHAPTYVVPFLADWVYSSAASAWSFGAAGVYGVAVYKSAGYGSSSYSNIRTKAALEGDFTVEFTLEWQGRGPSYSCRALSCSAAQLSTGLTRRRNLSLGLG